jgi:ribokinase
MDARVKPAHDENCVRYGAGSTASCAHQEEIDMGRVVVAGSINMDVVALAERHPKVGETVAGREIRYFPGGKGANQAVAAAKLGAETTLIGRAGTDAFGREMRAYLATHGLDLTFLRGTPDAHTGTALITLADGDNTIVVVPGANGLVSPADVAAISLAKGDVAVSQFEIPLPAISAFFERAREAGAMTLLNPAPAVAFDRALLELVDILVLNESELGLLAKVELRDTDDHTGFIEAARSLRMGGDKTVCVTLGKRGAVALVQGEPLIIPGRAVAAVDTTGAGDCLVGALAAQLASGTAVRDALEYANLAASICVQRMGAAPSMPQAGEVQAVITREGG